MENKNRAYRNQINCLALKACYLQNKMQLIRTGYVSNYREVEKFKEQFTLFAKSKFKFNEEKTGVVLTEQEFKMYGQVFLSFKNFIDAEENASGGLLDLIDLSNELCRASSFINQYVVKPIMGYNLLDKQFEELRECLLSVSKKLERIQSSQLSEKQCYAEVKKKYNQLLN